MYEGTCCLARGITFDRNRGSGVVCVFLFLTRVGEYVGIGLCKRTHTHTHCTYGVLGSEPRGRDETPEGPEKSSWTKSRYTCIRICVKSIHVYVDAKRRDEILD